MLVLSRKEDEKVLFPNLGISVQVLRLAGNKVRLGIEAPKDVHIIRDELNVDPNYSPPPDNLALNHKLGSRLRSRLRSAAKHLCAVHEQVEVHSLDEAEAAIFRVFNELKALDQEVAEMCGLGNKVLGLAQLRSTALLVEDNDNEAKLLAGFLRCREVDVEIARNGASAIEYLKNNETPDCVLLDMNMPRYNGHWTINEIRSNPLFCDVEVYAVSGMHPSECGVEIGPQGVNHWFQKPLDPEALVMELEKHRLGAFTGVSA